MAKTKAVSRKRLAPSHASSQSNNPKKTRKQEPASSTSSIQLIPSHQLKRLRRRQRAHLRRQNAVDIEEGDDRSAGQLAQAQEAEQAVEDELSEAAVAVEEVEQHAPQQIDQAHDDSEYFHTSFGGRNSQERNQRIQGWINNVSGPASDNEEEYAEWVGSLRRNASSHAQQVVTSNNDNGNHENHGTIPRAFLDPFMTNLMRDPVLLPTSRVTVDRSTIVDYLWMSHPSDPFSMLPLKIEDVIPNAALKSAIDAFLARQKKPEGRPTRRHLFFRDGNVADGTGAARRRLFEEAKPDGTPCPRKTKPDAISDEKEEQVFRSSDGSVTPAGGQKPPRSQGRRVPYDSNAFLGRRRGPAHISVTSTGMHHDVTSTKHRSNNNLRPRNRYNGFTHNNPRERDFSSIERLSHSDCNDSKCGCRLPRWTSSGHTETGSYDDRDYFSEEKYNLDYGGSPVPQPQLQRRRAGLNLAPRGGHPDLPFSGRQTRQTTAATRMRNAPLQPGQGYVSVSIAEQQQAQMLVGLYGGSDDEDE